MSIGVMLRRFADAKEALDWIKTAPAGALIEYYRGPAIDGDDIAIAKLFGRAAHEPESRLALFQKPIGDGAGGGRIFSYRCLVLTDGLRRALRDETEAPAAVRLGVATQKKRGFAAGIAPFPSSVARVAVDRRHLVAPDAASDLDPDTAAKELP